MKKIISISLSLEALNSLNIKKKETGLSISKIIDNIILSYNIKIKNNNKKGRLKK